MNSPRLCGGSPGGSSALSESVDVFHELWIRLKECHENALQELQLKVKKLKKERCLDAQRLEEFYNRNQQLREQQRALQDTIKVLEDRLRAGLCDRCAVTEGLMKKTQMEFENIHQENLTLIAQLKAERNTLQGENKRLSLELEHLQGCGLISPPPISVHRAKPLFSSTQWAAAPCPNAEVIKNGSPSLLCGVPSSSALCHRQRLSHTEGVKRKSLNSSKEEEQESIEEPLDLSEEKVMRRTTPDPSPGSSCPNDPPAAQKVPSKLDHVISQEPKKKKIWEAGQDYQQTSVVQPNPCSPLHHAGMEPGRRRSPYGLNSVPPDQGWSVDPGAELAQYDTDSPPQPPHQAKGAGETVDMDFTFVSHSMLQGRQDSSQDSVSDETGTEQRANDSLADIFDKTAYGEYESCPPDDSCDLKEADGSHDNDEEEEEEHVEGNCFMASKNLKSATVSISRNKLPFAHVEVVRKRDERRKLKGHTCKECEIYYADLPEAERQKKLSACSRHRFHYIPPSTPENFWEVGFPSTQTCVERGYIKEDDQTDVRLRRRRPYIAKFSPKAKEPKT
ncbi:DNA endonuclease RBBP8 [Chanos chanos]|uniref:DNA endonuclease RBBP8 n=1 Tax=Chanos chanos TaxID=29144 RepID=A0A6J2UW04_CHACN|nr:DNA endonuclease RBBP8 [Chanos chanos]